MCALVRLPEGVESGDSQNDGQHRCPGEKQSPLPEAPRGPRLFLGPTLFYAGSFLLFRCQRSCRFELALSPRLSLDRPLFSECQPFLDESLFRLAQFARPLAQPAFGFGQRRTPQQGPLVLPGLLPLAQRRPQPLLPGAKGPVGLHPVLQLPPTLDQGLVHHLHRFGARHVAASYDQPLVGQVLHQAPVVVAQLSARGLAAGVLRPLTGTHQLDEHPARLFLRLWVQRTKDLAGVAGQCALHAAGLLVPRVGQPAVALPLPEQGQGELEQGEIARLLAYIVQDALYESGLKGRPLYSGRLFHRRAQLLAVHGPQHHTGVLKCIGKGPVG